MKKLISILSLVIVLNGCLTTTKITRYDNEDLYIQRGEKLYVVPDGVPVVIDFENGTMEIVK